MNKIPQEYPHLIEGLSYDDVLLLPQYSEVTPDKVDATSRLTRGISLKVPLVSAAMDTVTEARSAIAMAQNGGIGIVHKNLSIEDQADHIARVKTSQSGMVSNPITVNTATTIGEALAIMTEKNISGLPVVDNHKLVGIVTGRDIRFETNMNRPIAEIMTSPAITAPVGTSSEAAVSTLHQHRIEKLPVVDGDKLVGLYTIRDIENTRRHPLATKDSDGRLMVGAAIGASGDFRERAEALLSAGADLLIIDTAHGHSAGVINAVKDIATLRKQHSFEIVAGNIATEDAATALCQAGADAIKVGIGPGSICTTRIVAGIGMPQFSAVLQCSKASKQFDVPVIADGGIKFSGDIVKALAAGAESVMVGSLLAGTEEAPGDLVIYQGKSYKNYRGMGSLGAMQRGSKDRYFQQNVDEQSKFVPEGIEGRVAYKGPIGDVLYQLLGGLRSGMGYVGAKDIATLQSKAKFVRMTNAALKESHVHDVYITRESPNYKLES